LCGVTAGEDGREVEDRERDHGVATSSVYGSRNR
jgi:hypothetical protein